jgi:hypothetical protein
VDNWSFGASDVGVTFGRTVNSQGTTFFVAQRERTPGTANAGLLIGPVVISELMYRPAGTGDEFVELRNLSRESVSLHDFGSGWRFDGITYAFPAGTAMPPGELLLVVPIAPATFRTKYSIPATTRIFGPYTGSQNNSGELIALEKPGEPYTDDTGATAVPYIRVDQVTYTNSAPWATAPNGSGPSLERIHLARFGDEPQNWRSSPQNGGSLGLPPSLDLNQWLAHYFTPAQVSHPLIGAPGADPDGDGLSNFREWIHGLDPWTNDDAPVSFDIDREGDDDFLSLRIRYSLSAVPLSIFADTSADLVNWNLATGVTTGSPLLHGDGTATVIFRHPAPIGAPGREYLRARFATP